MTNEEFINRYGIIPFDELSERELIYFALYPLEKTIVKVQVIDGKEQRQSEPSLFEKRFCNNYYKNIYNNAMENLGL